MKAVVESSILILLSLLIMYHDSCASEPLPRFAYIKKPVSHAWQSERLDNGLERTERAPKPYKEYITDFRKLTGILLNSNKSDEYSLHSNRKERDNKSAVHFHKERDKYTELSEDTKYLALILATASASLYMMPEELTKWSRKGRQGTNIFQRWAKHVESKPVWDEDHWAVNYIGHPYSGSAYYILARHNGLDWKEAGIYSTFVSTFMWEYGVELTGEVPSIQDLIFTPVGGVVLGELLLNAEDVIKRNDGKVLGSKLIGDISLVLINPAGSTINLLKRWTGLPARIKIKTEPFKRSLSGYDKTNLIGPKPISFPYYGMRLVFTYE